MINPRTINSSEMESASVRPNTSEILATGGLTVAYRTLLTTPTVDRRLCRANAEVAAGVYTNVVMVSND